LDTDLAGATIATEKTEAHDKKFVKRMRAFSRIPESLAEFRRKTTQLQQVCSGLSTVIVNDIRTQQGRTSGKETVDQMMGILMKDCEHLQPRLQAANYPISRRVGSSRLSCAEPRSSIVLEASIPKRQTRRRVSS